MTATIRDRGKKQGVIKRYTEWDKGYLWFVYDCGSCPNKKPFRCLNLHGLIKTSEHHAKHFHPAKGSTIVEDSITARQEA